MEWFCVYMANYEGELSHRIRVEEEQKAKREYRQKNKRIKGK